MPEPTPDNPKADDKTPVLEFKKAETSTDQLIQGLKLGLNFAGARRFSGLATHELKKMSYDDPPLMLKLMMAIAEGDANLLYKLRTDTHWQAWGRVLDYRKYQEQKRLARKEQNSNDQNVQSGTDDPLMKLVEEVFSLIEPGGELDAIDHLRDYITKAHVAKHEPSELETRPADQLRQLPGPDERAAAQDPGDAHCGEAGS
ncbi:MAG TPA: hypothetical protein VG269_03000 [Tepidisphaeraceae bacterium]|jgi:hypothetical protein|nr:hypothetical protein [Tepidisphaeraceae bacterium]